MATRSKAQEAHRVSVEFGIKDIAGFLLAELGRNLTAYLAGTSDPKAVTEWAKGSRTPRPDADQRLRAAYQVFHQLQTEESPHTVRQWFIGLNPQLDDQTPADVIREGQFRDVLHAARVYVSGG
ncbi:MAG TPA: hypothetical protein VFE19_01335 [Jatrophihabitantaceae bacterium]|nr:hypothetical protein [Jatrophihabitantaceae bacterium]